MKCPKCNKAFEEGQKFCSECGAPLPRKIITQCPNCHTAVKPGQKFCAACGKNLLEDSAGSVTDTSVNHTSQLHAAYAQRQSRNAVRCPECGKMTDSLKEATLFNKLLFLVAYTRWQTVSYTCCAECMRRHIADRTVSTLITANFIWPILVLPLHGYHLYRSYQKD